MCPDELQQTEWECGKVTTHETALHSMYNRGKRVVGGTFIPRWLSRSPHGPAGP